MKVFAAKHIKLNIFCFANVIIIFFKLHVIKSINGIKKKKKRVSVLDERLRDIWLSIMKMPWSFVLGTKERIKGP